MGVGENHHLTALCFDTGVGHEHINTSISLLKSALPLSLSLAGLLAQIEELWKQVTSREKRGSCRFAPIFPFFSNFYKPFCARFPILNVRFDVIEFGADSLLDRSLAKGHFMFGEGCIEKYFS